MDRPLYRTLPGDGLFFVSYYDGIDVDAAVGVRGAPDPTLYTRT